MVKGALFDIDGTLLDSDDFVYIAFDYVLQKHGYPLIPREEMAKLMGLDLGYIYTQFAPEADPGVLFKEHVTFQENNLQLVKAYPGVVDVLSVLKERGVRLGSITSRSKATTQKSLESTGLFPFFEVVYTFDDVVKAKPHPEAIEKALRFFGLAASEAMMIGDTEADVQSGKNAGVVTIGATYGMHGDRIKESNPDFLIGDIREVLPILERL